MKYRLTCLSPRIELPHLKSDFSHTINYSEFARSATPLGYRVIGLSICLLKGCELHNGPYALMRETINNIQALRFFAAFSVVFAHLQISRYSGIGIKPDLFAIGAFGVDIFFVISGFIMAFVSNGMKGSNIQNSVEFFRLC